MKRINAQVVLIAVVLSIAIPVAAQRLRSVRPVSVWAVPQCSEVWGLRSMRFLRDGQIAKNHNSSVNDAATDIAIGDVPNLLYAVFLDGLYESHDTGCSWTRTYGLPPAQTTTYIAAARKGTLYVYNESMLLRVSSSWTESLKVPERLSRLGVDPADFMHLRAIAVSGNAYESADGGANWNAVGTASTSLVYTAAFDPSNFDHALVGTAAGVLATADGGKTWEPSSLTGVAAWDIQFSPADPHVVFVQAGNSLYRAIDGGFSYGALQAPGITMTRSRIAPHLTQPYVVAVSVPDGIAMFDTAKRTTNVVKTIEPKSLVWLPSGVLYFSAPDSVVVF